LTYFWANSSSVGSYFCGQTGPPLARLIVNCVDSVYSQCSSWKGLNVLFIFYTYAQRNRSVLGAHTVGHCYSSSYHFLHVSCFRGNTTPPQGVVTVHNCPTISLCKTRGPTWNFRFYTKDLSLLADDNAAVPYTTYIIRPYIEPIYVYFTFRYRL
jgi:hypothetical protein